MAVVPGQIVALGGGGFLMEPENLALDQYVLDQARAPRPGVCFVPTASGDSDNTLRRFYESFCTLECRPSHLSLFRPPADLRAFVRQQDVFYVGGGNTRSMLALWREWGVDALLREAVAGGAVLAGVSAGAICWFERGVTDSATPTGGTTLSALSGLGFLPGTCCPHYDGEAHRRPEYHRLLRAGEVGPGWGIDDGVAVHFVDGAPHRVVASRPEVAAHRVRLADGQVREDRVEPERL